MLKKLKKLSEEIINENPWSTFRHDTYEKPNGDTGNYYYMQSPGFVMVVPKLQNGKFLMVRQFRYLHQLEGLAFCAGGMKVNTPPLENAQRELKEETGYNANEWNYLGWLEPSPGLMKDRGHIFFAILDRKEEIDPDDTEEIELLELSAEEIDESIRNGKIWCGQTIASWSMAQKFLSE